MKWTRRDLIRMGTAALAGSSLKSFADIGETVKVTIPSSGEQLPAIGIGTVGFRGDPGSPDMAPLRETLQVFARAGGRVVDTSPNYGNSEQVLGRLLDEIGIRDRVFLATKVDREDPAEGIRRMQGSEERLGRRIDLMQVHNLRGTDAQMKTLLEWRAAGRIRYIGATTHRSSQHEELEQVMQRYPLDFIQVNYSLADRAAARRVLPLAVDRGIAVLVNRPFGKGDLFAAVRGKELPEWSADLGAHSWAQVFLKYILGHPAQTLPIPGTTKPHHAADNMGALSGPLPDQGLRHEMEGFMDRLAGRG